MPLSPSDPSVIDARAQLRQHASVVANGLSGTVARSWQRSLVAGLLPDGGLQGNAHCSAQDLRQKLERNRNLLAHSRPVMEYLFEQVRNNQNIVVLADSQGTLVHTLGDAVFLDKAQRVALSCGASWHENHRGTNAIGTALVEGAGVEIHGSEHFLQRHSFLTCAAAPIQAFDGRVLGILDISGDQHNGHPHTLGLVSTAARLIENRLLIASHHYSVRLHLHKWPEGIGTVGEGLLALSDEGVIVGANRASVPLLQNQPITINVTPVDALLGTSLDDLIDHARKNPAKALQLPLHRGGFVWVMVVVSAHPSTVAGLGMCSIDQSRPVAPEKPVQDALATLDTGDVRWRSATDKVRRVLNKSIPILIQGESGVGKEYLARAIHDSSACKTGPFVAINCAAIPETLMEAELFGYSSGAFTGARKEGSIGRIREAHHGTLFLDEIGDMPLSMQARLLRVLQDHTVMPLGGGRSVQVEFSLVCATHCKLLEYSQNGRFRSDLYYRINGLTVQLPALRERTDFAALVQGLLAQFNPAQAVELHPDVAAPMSQYPWPGNLRQLASVLRTASAMLDAHETLIHWQHLPDDIVQELQALPKQAAQAPAATDAPAPPSRSNLADLTQNAIHDALARHHGNVTQAARELGISRQTLYRRGLQSPTAC